MTPYKEICNELLSLGWTKSPGKGDHVKFNKEGTPTTITVNRNLRNKGHTYQNMLADIRRAEPNFTMGLHNSQLSKIDEPKETDITYPENIPIWIRPNHPVRLTGMENRDWSLLDNLDSVMNKQYIVNEINKSGQVKIQCMANPEEVFYVNPQDLDTFKTQQCSSCGRTLPVSQFNDALNNCCKECEEKKLTLEREKQKTMEDQARTLKKAMKKVPENKIPAEVKAAMSIVKNETPNTPYMAWKRFLHRMMFREAIVRGLKNDRSREYLALQKQIHSLTYQTKKYNDITVFNVDTNLWENVELIHRYVILLWAEMSNVLDEDKFIFLLINKPARLRQFVSGLAPENYPDNLPTILKEDKECFTRFHKDKDANLYLTSEAISSEIGFPEDKNITVTPKYKLNPGYDTMEFESAPTHAEIEIIVNDETQEEKDKYNNILNKAKDFLKTHTATIIVLPLSEQYSLELRAQNTFSNAPAKEESQEHPENKSEAYGIENGEVLLKLKVGNDTIEIFGIEPEDTETENDYIKLLSETVTNILTDGKGTAINKAFEKAYKKYNNKNDNMDYLDETNPNSANAKAGELTTRELLRELMSRGLEFGSITQKITRTIDVSTI